jgi:cellobiose phosphorylase
MNAYGYFDDDAREYIITNPKTPVKWINYIGTLAFGGFVDQTGGMLICRQDPALNRITKYLTQGPPSDFRGTTLYLRFPADEGGYVVFSPFIVPTMTPFDLYECHVGLGYSTFISEIHGLKTEVCIFIPQDENLVVQQVQVTNLTEHELQVDVIPVVEYTHPDALKQLTNADWVPQTMQSFVHEEEGGRLTLSQAPFMFKTIQRNFFTTDMPISSFETDRQEFLGDNGFGSWASPASLQGDELNNSLALRGDNIAAMMLHLGVLAPGESHSLVTLLGQYASIEEALPKLQYYRHHQALNTAFEDLRASWDTILSVAQVHTPDADMDRMLNIHNPRQCAITLNWSRYLSLYQLGFGARGIGFRDSSQDVIGALMGSPVPSKQLLKKLMQVQKRDGSAMHQFNPLTMIANVGDSAEEEDRPKFYSDDHLWGILAVTAYLKETGDFGFLKEKIPFYEKDKAGTPIEKATLWEHLKRAIQFTHAHVGKNGLPLLGFADWNDTVNLPEGAESLFTAYLYGWALKELIALGKMLGKKKSVKTFRAYYKAMKKIVNAVAWDGEWYVRYFDQNGKPLGSHKNEQGQIYTNAQSWAVLSGFASPKRALKVMDAIYLHLNTPNGIKVSTPGYDGFDPEKGGVTTYPPGAKENGGIFLHTNPWVMMAETILGRGERAYQYYSQINPAKKNADIDTYECEPYVYAQNILGDEHPQFGLARNAWLTGTASWAYQAGLKFMLGVRPEYEGLRIDPCIPAGWEGFSVTRRFRGTEYHITVRNPDHVSKGVKSVLLDDRALDQPLLPIMENGGQHVVEVLMG